MSAGPPPFDAALLARAAARSTATLHEAAQKTGALPAAIKPLALSVRLCGPAFPVRSPGGDNLWLHHALYAARPGEVLVVDVSGTPEFGYFGEVMAVAAVARGLTGLVIDGGVRDAERMLAMNFPVFSRTPAIRGTIKDPRAPGSLGTAVRLGEVSIERGDLVCGDGDGVVVLPREKAADIIAAAERRDAEEEQIFARLRGGESTLDIYRLPTPAALREPS
jgi:4-hydroxy-4-methyl-2-oxoglutarate aldolase